MSATTLAAATDPWWRDFLTTTLAVVVGAAISWWGQARLADGRIKAEADARREANKRVDEVDRRVREAEELAAARVLRGDLSIAADVLKSMERERAWWPFYVLASPHWSDLQHVIARSDRITTPAWVTISQAAIELRIVEDGIRRRVAPGGPNEGSMRLGMTTDAQVEGVRRARASVSEAHRALAELAGAPPDPPGLLHDDTN